MFDSNILATQACSQQQCGASWSTRCEDFVRHPQLPRDGQFPMSFQWVSNEFPMSLHLFALPCDILWRFFIFRVVSLRLPWLHHHHQGAEPCEGLSGHGATVNRLGLPSSSPVVEFLQVESFHPGNPGCLACSWRRRWRSAVPYLWHPKKHPKKPCIIQQYSTGVWLSNIHCCISKIF